MDKGAERHGEKNVYGYISCESREKFCVMIFEVRLVIYFFTITVSHVRQYKSVESLVSKGDGVMFAGQFWHTFHLRALQKASLTRG